MSTLDQGFWPDGIHTAPTDAALRFDLAEHKGLGFNTVRKHIKVEPDRWYYWADRLGLMVWQDMPAMRRLAKSARPLRRRPPEQFERSCGRWSTSTTAGRRSSAGCRSTRAGASGAGPTTGRIADEVKA